MRVIFMGTPEFAVPVLEALVAAGHEVVAAYSQPPRRGNRGRITPSPVQARAEALGIPVRTPLSFRKEPEAVDAFAALGADVAVVAAYGLILPQAVLDAPRLGCLNVHASLLPRWRGAAPIQRAILAGDGKSGVCIMQMEAGLDTGPVRYRAHVVIGNETAGQLTKYFSQLGADMMVEVLADFDHFPPIPQSEEGVTYAAKIDKAEARLDFTRHAEILERQVRAFNPTPGAYFELRGERIRVHSAQATFLPQRPPGMVVDLAALAGPDAVGRNPGDFAIACAGSAIRPLLVQRAGRGVMTVQELLRGFPIPAGTQL